MSDQKSSEDRKTDAFLGEVHKKKLVMRLGNAARRRSFKLKNDDDKVIREIDISGLEPCSDI